MDPVYGQKIYDSSTGEYRTAGYGDIVILLRTVTGWAEVFVDCLMEAGIPAYAQTRTGYFTAKEVQCILNLLRIIDNPMQDIPLAAVLKSPIGGFSSEELALLMAQFKRDVSQKDSRGLYGAIKFCLRSEESTLVSSELRDKVKKFNDMLCDFR